MAEELDANAGQPAGDQSTISGQPPPAPVAPPPPVPVPPPVPQQFGPPIAPPELWAAGLGQLPPHLQPPAPPNRTARFVFAGLAAFVALVLQVVSVSTIGWQLRQDSAPAAAKAPTLRAPLTFQTTEVGGAAVGDVANFGSTAASAAKRYTRIAAGRTTSYLTTAAKDGTRIVAVSNATGRVAWETAVPLQEVYPTAEGDTLSLQGDVFGVPENGAEVVLDERTGDVLWYQFEVDGMWSIGEVDVILKKDMAEAVDHHTGKRRWKRSIPERFVLNTTTQEILNPKSPDLPESRLYTVSDTGALGQIDIATGVPTPLGTVGATGRYYIADQRIIVTETSGRASMFELSNLAQPVWSVDTAAALGVTTGQADAQLCGTGVLCLSQYETKKIAAYALDTGKQLWAKESVAFNPSSDDIFPDRVLITTELLDAAGQYDGSLDEILDPKTGKVIYTLPDLSFPDRLSRDGILLPQNSGDTAIDTLTGHPSQLTTRAAITVPCDWNEGIMACVAKDGRFTIWKVTAS
jgi:outer membrane protein assembly factor BamB